MLKLLIVSLIFFILFALTPLQIFAQVVPIGQTGESQIDNVPVPISQTGESPINTIVPISQTGESPIVSVRGGFKTISKLG